MPTLAFFVFPFVFGWGVLAILIIPYFLPTIIAMLRRTNSTGGIFVLNFFLGWTFIGWVASLVWAIAGRTTPTTIIVNNTIPPNAPQAYPPPPTYAPPPYTTEPTQAIHQTSPTLRRNPNQPDDRSNA
jgi:hypothetical protein